MNPKKVIPMTKGQCRCLCCSDCSYYDENVSYIDCGRRNYLYYFKEGKLGV